MHPVEANLLFVQLPQRMSESMVAAGHVFAEGAAVAGGSRLCCSWRTTEADVDGLLEVAKASVSRGPAL